MFFNTHYPYIGGGGGAKPKFTYTGQYTEIDDGGGNWRVKFLTSGTLTLFNKITVDVFLVGGGGGGAANNSFGSGNAGGAGGFTQTNKQVTLEPGDYTITIGNGGAGNNYYQSISTKGGDTSAFGATASGGASKVPNTDACAGVNGGSGSGAVNSVGGSDGGNGGSSGGYGGGSGQGTTTREFGEPSGDLYAGGGGGSSNTSGRVNVGGIGGGGNGVYYNETSTMNGGANTGGGGGGRYIPGSANRTQYGGTGGSGIVIIRNAR